MFIFLGTVRIWHANTYRLESTLNYGMERVWTIACRKGSNNVALGYDEGSIMIKVNNKTYIYGLGNQQPVGLQTQHGESESQTGCTRQYHRVSVNYVVIIMLLSF